jgi:hypothetical protein
MNPGLYQKIETLLARRRQQDATAKNPGAEPYVRHTAEMNAENAGREMKMAMEATLENRLIIAKIDDILNQLTASPHTSRHRSLVVTKLEEAQDRLRRELGPEATAEEEI